MNARVWKIAPLLFGSGFCALVYQTAWQRELRLIFGASTAASAAVLAIFMGGLGLGGALLGARVDRDARPLNFYAVLELVISLGTALTPLLVLVARSLYIALGGTVSLGLAGGTLVRLVLSALVLAVPTLLMGGTLPAAARAAETPEDVRRRALAVLYGVNTLGAVAGATASTFLLFEVFGTRTTLWLACLLNLLVALIARVVARGLPEQPLSPPGAEAAAPGASSPGASSPPLPPRPFVLASAALVGFAFFLMEMVWYRMMSPLLGGSTFTFGLILLVALAGIGLGGTAYAAWGQTRPATLGGFALTCLLEAFLVAVPLALGDRLAVLTVFLRPLSVFGFGGLVLSWSGIAALVVFPAAFVSGVQFPLLLALLGRGGSHVGRQVGLAYAWNTVGSIIGSLAGGFGLLPLLTAPGVWRCVGGVLVALGLAAAALSWRLERTGLPRLLPALLATGLTLVLLSAEGPTAIWRHGGIGAGRSLLKTDSHQELQDSIAEWRRKLLWSVDGVESSVGLVSANGLSFFVNGKSDGNSVLDADTQVMGGLIGTLAHPDPRHALVIGLGTGSTAGWLGALPQMERVDAVEIEPAILEVARRCEDVNEHVLDNPKVNLVLGDAREVLLASKETYDIIFSEPSNPYRAGIASLFSREFYRAARQRMAPGGIFLQWVQAYEVDARTIRSIYATLSSEFGAVETWQAKTGDLILMATEAPLRHDFARMRARVAEEPYRRALAATWNTRELEGVLTHYLAGPALARKLAEGQEALLNTDDLSYVEFAFARNVGRTATGFSWHMLRQAGIDLGADRMEGDPSQVNWQRIEELRLFADRKGWLRSRRPDLDFKAIQERYDAFDAASQDLTQALRPWREGRWQARDLPELYTVALLMIRQGDEAALPLLAELEPYRSFDARLLRAQWLLRKDRFADATQELENAFTLLRREPWSNKELFDRILPLGERIARKDAALGQRLWKLMAQPFSNHRADLERLQLRMKLALLPGAPPAWCVEAFAPFEPHVPWAAQFLEERARCYVKEGSPLEDQALADFARFSAAEPPKLLEEDAGPPAG